MSQLDFALECLTADARDALSDHRWELRMDCGPCLMLVRHSDPPIETSWVYPEEAGQPRYCNAEDIGAACRAVFPFVLNKARTLVGLPVESIQPEAALPGWDEVLNRRR
jgi:hypothetical protein